MRKLTVFNSISVDGYFTDAKGDISWAHEQSDAEWNDFTSSNASGDVEMVFGRVTYEMMASFWPSEEARKTMPLVAKGMNESRKYVFSRSLEKVSWQNAKLVKGDLAGEIRTLKKEKGPDLLIMGSGTLVSQLTDARLIDGYQLVLVPIVLGAGRSMFDGVRERMRLKLRSERRFKNGNVVLSYEL